MGIKEKAVRNYEEKKYNCCQAVVCAYCEEYGMDDREIFKLAEAFGGGMGGLQDTCGAVTGAFMGIGMRNSAGDKSEPTVTKANTYADVKEVARKFEEKAGSLYCRDLKALVNGVQPVSCKKCVEIGAELLEKYIEEHGWN
jgi:C_GCAxxG_C_C family probable redox protein